MKKTKNRQQNGITLIALVITIIVMLILVAVTISMAVNGGLFGYAKKATGEMENAINEEQALAEGKIKIGETWYNSIDEYIGMGTDNGTYDETAKDEKGLLTENATYINGGYTATIPKGFKLLLDVEDKINEGIVIQDKDGNEYVWIPVEEGTFERTGWWENEPTTKTLEEITEDLTQDELKAYIAKSYGYASIEDMMQNYGDEPFETYEELLAYEWNEAQTEEEVEQYTIEWFQDYYWFAGALSEDDIENREKDPTELYSDMVNSVNTYGGFYIGRYEAGSNDKDRYTEITDETVLVKKGAYPYNYVAWGLEDYEEELEGNGHGAVYLSEHMYDNQDVGVKSTLCYGVQWDATLRFIKDKVNVTDSTTWGNYYDSTFTFGGEYSSDECENWDDDETVKQQYSEWILQTGASEQNKAKNIYDLAGNVYEWTMEAYSSDYRISRGGYYNSYGVGDPASRRNDLGPDNYDSSIGFRPALYITNE